jgi:hypothetical protein
MISLHRLPPIMMVPSSVVVAIASIVRVATIAWVATEVGIAGESTHVEVTYITNVTGATWTASGRIDRQCLLVYKRRPECKQQY